MKAVVLCAGASHSDWPMDSKPKCLHHVKGEMVLDNIINTLLKGGFQKKDILIVAGYERAHFNNFVRDNPELTVIYNPWWNRNAISSISVGVFYADDDCLIICGDILINPEEHGLMIRDFLKNPQPIGAVYASEPWGELDLPWYNGHHQIALVKLSKSLWSELLEGSVAHRMAEHWMNRMKRKYKKELGVYFGAFLLEALYIYREHVGWIYIPEAIKDLDRYRDTDESKVSK